MGLRGALGRIAAEAPVPVFAVAGSRMRAAVQDLRLRPGLRVADTPRGASVLLVAGDVGDEHGEALARLHDLLPHPRATVTWQADRLPDPLDGVDAAHVAGGDPLPTIQAAFADLVLGRRPSEPAVLPDVDPQPWRGVGPYGQGGTGMTGGTPYGRPLAEVGPDRDGLRLDILPLEIGPFFPRLPPGLVLDAQLAGDVVVEVSVASASLGAAAAPAPSPFVRALAEPVPIRELEVARARDHLRWVAEGLLAQGLPALAIRALALARDVGPGDGLRIRRFGWLLQWTQLFRWSLPRAGAINPAALDGQGLGPVARAAGLAEDARLEDPVYRDLGFEPIVVGGNDAPARWRVRLAEAARSLDLAALAGDRETSLVGRVESPRGRLEAGDPPSGRALRLVPQLLPGLEWSDALGTLVSLDLDLEEAEAALVVPGAAAA